MANIKISQLTAAAAALGTQEFEVNESGSSKKVTGSQIAAFIESEVSSGPSFTGQASFDDGSAAAPSITNTGDTNTGMFFPAADTIAFAEGGVESMRIDSSGNVFVGGTTGTAKLNIENSVSTAYSTTNTLAATPAAYFYNSNGTAGTAGTIRLDGGTSGGNAATTISAVHVGSGSSALTFGTRLSNSDVTERMRITSAGNVGIGTSSPTAGYRLDVSGQAQIGDGGGNADINFNASSTGRFLVAGTERLRIASAGQIGIGGANYGTSGQVLTSGGSGAAPSWASADTYTLLGTINTTSGTSQTLSGLTLTSYTAMVLEFVDVNVGSSLSNFNLRINSTTGPIISENWTGNTTDGWFGIMTIMLSTGVFSSTLAVGATVPTSAQGEVWAGDCNVTTASTSVTIALSNNNFAAGSIRVYGVK